MLPRWRALMAAMLVVFLACVAPWPTPAAAAQGAAVPSFQDMGSYPWARPAVDGLAVLGVVQGTAPGQFDPAAPTTRAQMAVILARLFGWHSTAGSRGSAAGGGLPAFADASSIPAWALPSVEAASALGVVRGELGGLFDPGGDVTWAEAAVMVDRAFAYPATPSGSTPGLLADLPAGSATPTWAEQAVADDVRAGALVGLPALLYQPGQPITRAELADFLFGASQGEAVNSHLLSGHVTSVGSDAVTLGTALGIRSVAVAGGAAVFAGSAPSRLSDVRVGDGATAVLEGGAAQVLQVTSVPEAASLSGTVTSVAAGQLGLRIGGGLTALVPLAPGATITVNGQIGSLASVAAGDSAVAALDGQGRATLVQVNPAGVVPGPTGALPRATETSSQPPAPATGSTAAGSGGAGSTGASAVSQSVPAAPNPSAPGAVASFLLSPNPIAPSGSLAVGQEVVLTLTAVNAADQPVPDATVYISLATESGHGIAAAGGSYLAAAPQVFTTGPDGRLTITYTAPTTLPNGGTDTLTVQNSDSSPTLASTDTYTYSTVSPQAAQPAAVRYVFTPDPMAQAATLQPAQRVSVKLTVLGAGGSPVPGATVYLSLNTDDPGSSVSVNGQPLASYPEPFTADSSGTIALIYQVAAIPLPSFGSDTITAQNASTGSDVTATDSYFFAAPTSGLAPSSTLTGLIQAVDAKNLTLIGPGGVTNTLAIAPQVTVTGGGQTLSPSSLMPGDAVTLSLSSLGSIDSITLNHSAGLDSTAVTGYLAGVDTSTGLVRLYESGGLQAYTLSAGAPVIDQGQPSSLSALPLGESIAATLNPSSQITYLQATAPVQPVTVVSGTVTQSPLAGILTVSSGGRSESIDLGPYAVAVIGSALEPVASLPPGAQVTVVEGAAQYGSSLVIVGP